MAFELEANPGSYQVKVSALDIVSLNQLGVGKAEGSPNLTAIDLNNDGVDEYIMENDSVKITLLATGGRVIEYIIKSRNDNALYKIWPVKPVDDKENSGNEVITPMADLKISLDRQAWKPINYIRRKYQECRRSCTGEDDS